jgi:hypothetical protein
MRAQLGSDLLKTVASAGGRLKKSGINPGEILNLEDLGRGIGTVLGEATVHCYTVGVELHIVSITLGSELSLLLTFSQRRGWPLRQ